MHTHQGPNPAREREDRSEHKSGNRRLLGAWKSLIKIMKRRKNYGRQQHRQRLCARTASNQLADSLEQVSAKEGLFPKAGCDDHHRNDSQERSFVSYQVVIGLIDRFGAE